MKPPTEVSMPAVIRLRTSDYLKYVRLKGWKLQAKQAEAFGLHESTVGRVLNGTRSPSSEFIAGVLSAFQPDLSFEDLFEVVDDEEPEQAAS